MEQLEELVIRFKDGDKEAFREIYEKTSRYVYFTCIGFLKNEQDAADVSQEVYLTVMQQIDSLEDTAKFIPWINRITVNKCRNYLAKKSPVLMEEEELEECQAETEEEFLPEEYAINKEKREQVLKIMRSSLSDVLYQTVLLYYFNEMTVPEIAEAMGCPAGTVTYRLSAARAKIKEGVLQHEKKHGEKLYALTAVLFFGKLFKAKAAEMAVPAQPEGIVSARSAKSAAAKAAGKGAKTMFKTVKAKCIAGLLSLAVIGGGITAVVLVNSNQDQEVVQGESRNKTQEDENTKNPDKQSDDKKTDDKQPDDNRDKENGDSGKEPAETPDVSAGKDYKAMAEQIDAAFITYLEAMKAGDIETILSRIDPDNVMNRKIYNNLSGLKDYESGKEFIRTVYENLRYSGIEEGSTEYRLKDMYERGKDEFYLKIKVVLPENLLFDRMLTVPGVLFQDGEFIPAGYEVTSAEEAMQIVRTVMKRIPLTSDIVKVEMQEDGTFYFEISNAFSIIDMMDFASSGAKENFLEDFITNKIPGGCIVGTSDVAFAEGSREEWEQILSLLKQNDFVGLCELANSDTSKYTRGTAYKTREELTEEQRAFFDSYIEQIEVCISDESSPKIGKRSTTVIVIAPALSLDTEEMAWLTENGVKETNIAWRIGGDGIGSLKSGMGNLMICWKQAINYAEYKIK